MTEERTLSFGLVRIGETAIAIPLENLSEVFHSRAKQSLPLVSEQLQGGIDLRGKLIPILNMAVIGSFCYSKEQPDLGIVIDHGQRSLAFYIDEILGIANISSSKINLLVQNEPAVDAYFSSIFSFNGTFVSILDVACVFALPGIFAAIRSEAPVVNAAHKGPPMLTFMAGDALYSVPAIHVHAAVPRQEIMQTAITSGPCLGEITYHGRRIPIVCPVSILGVGKRQTNSLSEVVILRISGDLLLGFAVDSIHEIRTFTRFDNKNLPVGNLGLTMIERVLPAHDGKQIFVVDVEALSGSTDLINIAKLSSDEPDKPVTSVIAEGEAAVGAVVRERMQYLVLDLHKRIAVPLLQVTCILEKPSHLTQANRNTDGLLGYFARRGETVVLIDLRERFGAGPVQGEKAQVLLTGGAGKQFGFLVDHVVGIELSQWRSKKSARDLVLEDPIVKLGSGSTAQTLPLFDLTTISDLNADGIADGDLLQRAAG